MLSVLLEDGTEVNICHLVIDDSSQWVIGGNISCMCDIEHKEGDYLELPLRTKRNDFDQISIDKWDMQCYITADCFYHKDFHFSTAHPDSVNVCRVSLSRSKETHWKTRKKIILTRLTAMCATTLIFMISKPFSREIRFEMKTVQITSVIFSTRVLHASKPLYLPRCGLFR